METMKFFEEMMNWALGEDWSEIKVEEWAKTFNERHSELPAIVVKTEEMNVGVLLPLCFHFTTTWMAVHEYQARLSEPEPFEPSEPSSCCVQEEKEVAEKV